MVAKLKLKGIDGSCKIMNDDDWLAGDNGAEEEDNETHIGLVFQLTMQ